MARRTPARTRPGIGHPELKGPHDADFPVPHPLGAQPVLCAGPAVLRRHAHRGPDVQEHGRAQRCHRTLDGCARPGLAFKPLWSPFLELLRSKKLVIVTMQFTGAIGLALLAGALQLPMWFGASLAVFFVLAYASATHDIAADGLYMSSLSDTQQAAYAGWQGAFFNASKFLTLGGLLVLAGHLEKSVGVFNALVLDLLAAGGAARCAGHLQRSHAARHPERRRR